MRRVRVLIVLGAMLLAALASASIGGGAVAASHGSHLAGVSGHATTAAIPFGKRWG